MYYFLCSRSVSSVADPDPGSDPDPFSRINVCYIRILDPDHGSDPDPFSRINVI